LLRFALTRDLLVEHAMADKSVPKKTMKRLNSPHTIGWIPHGLLP
jgi:hypothetical protein